MKSKPYGFSLVEIILAIGIFAFAAVTVLALLGRGMQTSREFQLEGTSSILSGKITSLLKATHAWSDAYSSNWGLKQLLGDKNLSQIANGGIAISTNLYTRGLVHKDDPERPSSDELEIEVVTEISPLNAPGAGGSLMAEDALNQAIGRIRDLGKNAVFVRIKISYPANAPERLRSTRDFVAIIAKSADE